MSAVTRSGSANSAPTSCCTPTASVPSPTCRTCSVVVSGLDDWDLANAERVVEDRLLAAVQAQLGTQVETLRTPPYTQETADPFGEWARVGVPVRLFPRWLRCSDTRCNRLALAGLRPLHAARPTPGGRSASATSTAAAATARTGRPPFPPGSRSPANAVTSMSSRGCTTCTTASCPEHGEHTLRLVEQGTTGEAANLIVQCSCDAQRSMAPAFGQDAWKRLPACRGRHPHLDAFEPCGLETRTLGLGATNGWFAMRLRVFSLPRADDEVEQRVAENWGQLSLRRRSMPRDHSPSSCCRLSPAGRTLSPTASMPCGRRSSSTRPTATTQPDTDDLDLATPEWEAFTRPQAITLPDFTTKREGPPAKARDWLREVTLVPRLREVSALFGFTRIDAPEWDVTSTDFERVVRLSRDAPTWVPCAQTRGEGIFLRFDEAALAAWETASGRAGTQEDTERRPRGLACRPPPAAGSAGRACATCCCTPSRTR